MYRFDSIYSFAPELCIEVINLGVKLFTLQIVLLRRSGAGPSEHGGTVGIRPNHLFAATLSHSTPTREWVDYTHNTGMSQATLKPFLWACRATFILCNKKALAYYYRSSAWRDRSPERVVTIHKSPAQLYFLFGIFIIPRRCKYANEAGGPPEAKGVT